VIFRPIEPLDVPTVLALNQGDVDFLAPLDSDRLTLLCTMTHHAHVCELDDAVAGFVLTFPPGTAYDSKNYAWFSDRFDDFLYLDRIVTSPAFRRQGVASFIYDSVEADATHVGRVLLEVNIEPPNEPSLVFHQRRGYVELGRIDHGGKITQMLEKPLGR
jgi:uncharacterized protein